MEIDDPNIKQQMLRFSRSSIDAINNQNINVMLDAEERKQNGASERERMNFN